MYIGISDIERAVHVDDGSIELICRGLAMAGDYSVNINITASSVTVARVTPLADAPPIDVARINVMGDVVQATRRLFGLVGSV